MENPPVVLHDMHQQTEKNEWELFSLAVFIFWQAEQSILLRTDTAEKVQKGGQGSLEIWYGFHRMKDISSLRKQVAEERYERPMKSWLGDVSTFLRVQRLWGGR